MLIAQQTEAIAFRCAGNHLAFVDRLYREPFQAMERVATITALSTWTSFTMTDQASGNFATVQFPFRQTEGYGGLGMIITIFSNSRSLFAFRFQTKTLAGHTVTTSTSQVAYMSGGSAPVDVVTATFGGSFDHQVSSCWTNLESPDLDSTRRFVVEPQIQVVDTKNPIIDIGESIIVHARSILIYELPPGTVGV